METYDPVAESYSAAFTRIDLRIFEWAWLRKQVATIEPTAVLDLCPSHHWRLTHIRVGTVFSAYAGVDGAIGRTVVEGECHEEAIDSVGGGPFELAGDGG